MKKLRTLCSKIIVATVVSVVFVVGIALNNFENRFIITAKYWLQLFILGRAPRTSMAMNSSGSLAGNNRSLCCCFFDQRLPVHDSQFLTIP